MESVPAPARMTVAILVIDCGMACSLSMHFLAHQHVNQGGTGGHSQRVAIAVGGCLLLCQRTATVCQIAAWRLMAGRGADRLNARKYPNPRPQPHPTALSRY